MVGSFRHFIDDRYLLQSELNALKTKIVYTVELHRDKGLLLGASIGGVVFENLFRKTRTSGWCAVGLLPNPLFESSA